MKGESEAKLAVLSLLLMFVLAPIGTTEPPHITEHKLRRNAIMQTRTPAPTATPTLVFDAVPWAKLP
jgi:hypothetical protein